MHAKQLPMNDRIKIAEASLSYLNRQKEIIETRIKLFELGISEMYESQAKLDREQALEHIEMEHDNIKEKIYAIENWLVEIGAPGWGTKL